MRLHASLFSLMSVLFMIKETISKVCRYRKYSTAMCTNGIRRDADIDALKSFFTGKSRIVAVTGAGISTESGIPDYRGENGSYKKGHKPMIHSDFVSKETSRKRYWARSMLGYNAFSLSKPNNAHIALARLEYNGYIDSVITQNVDRLHQKAGSKEVCDLHGRNDKVGCIHCGYSMARGAFQKTVETININHEVSSVVRRLSTYESLLRADGDAELGSVNLETFTVPSCPRCGGILKPEVVFFGDSVPLDRVKWCFERIEQSDGVLVVGTSLEVFSSYRFVLRADALNIPIIIVNKGETKAERMKLKNIVYKSDENCASILNELPSILGLSGA